MIISVIWLLDMSMPLSSHLYRFCFKYSQSVDYLRDYLELCSSCREWDCL